MEVNTGKLISLEDHKSFRKELGNNWVEVKGTPKAVAKLSANVKSRNKARRKAQKKSRKKNR